MLSIVFFFQAEDGIRDLVRSRGLGDVYKRQVHRGPDQDDYFVGDGVALGFRRLSIIDLEGGGQPLYNEDNTCLLYTSDAADERSSVDLGGRRIIKKKKQQNSGRTINHNKNTTNYRIQT